jgi:hypothetical protein
MKSKLNLLMAAACLLSSTFFLASCEKSSLKENAPQSAETRLSTKGGEELSEGREYKMTDVVVELTDEGREQFRRESYATIRQSGDNTYRTIIYGGGPWPPVEPIICDGMTASQLWADIMTRWNNFKNSPQGQSAQAYANATCKPVGICIANCGVAVAFLLPPSIPCATYNLDEYIAASAIRAQLVEEAP